MKIKVNFGLMYTQETTWHDAIERFPTTLSYRGVKYEFVFYDRDPTKAYAWILTFVELAKHDPAFKLDCSSWESRFASNASYDCQCGAVHSTFKWDHMRFCPKWKPWDQI